MKRIALVALPLAAFGIWMIWRPADSTMSAELTGAFNQYEKVVGVFPNEFLRFPAVEQEGYLRGVLDGEYYLAEANKDSHRDDFVNCLNAKFTTILSGAKSFVEREGEQKYLMPWTLSRLVGQNCPKETRVSPEKSPGYTEATTYLKLTSISLKPSDKAYTEEQQNLIDKAFIRGVLDGTVFGLYGHSAPDLADYLTCLSKPGSLEKIFQVMQIQQNLGQDLDQSQAYAVVQGAVHACKEPNE